MDDYAHLPLLSSADALRVISEAPISVAQKLLSSSLITQSRSFVYTPEGKESFLVLDVTHFLNHRINTKLIAAAGEELAALLTPFDPDIILTAPSSGNIPAITTALCMPRRPDVIYAPKGTAITMTDVIQAHSRSYTHGGEVNLTVAKDCFPPGARVAIGDDFLDTGRTVVDLINIVSQAQGAAVAFFFVIEKPFGGRALLREAGFVDEQIISLIKIDSMRPGKLKLHGFDSWFSLVRS